MDVFGKELPSIEALLDESIEEESELPPQISDKWLKIQMSRSAHELNAALAPRISKRGFLEKTELVLD